jgi:hypothetical protein
MEYRIYQKKDIKINIKKTLATIQNSAKEVELMLNHLESTECSLATGSLEPSFLYVKDCILSLKKAYNIKLKSHDLQKEAFQLKSYIQQHLKSNLEDINYELSQCLISIDRRTEKLYRYYFQLFESALKTLKEKTIHMSLQLLNELIPQANFSKNSIRSKSIYSLIQELQNLYFKTSFKNYLEIYKNDLKHNEDYFHNVISYNESYKNNQQAYPKPLDIRNTSEDNTYVVQILDYQIQLIKSLHKDVVDSLKNAGKLDCVKEETLFHHYLHVLSAVLETEKVK